MEAAPAARFVTARAKGQGLPSTATVVSASAMMFAKAEVAVTGELSFYTQAADSGNQVHRGFCGNCGSPVMNRNDGYPDNLYIHAATLDSPSAFTPSTSVCSEFAQPWDQPSIE